MHSQEILALSWRSWHSTTLLSSLSVCRIFFIRCRYSWWCFFSCANSLLRFCQLPAALLHLFDYTLSNPCPHCFNCAPWCQASICMGRNGEAGKCHEYILCDINQEKWLNLCSPSLETSGRVRLQDGLRRVLRYLSCITFLFIYFKNRHQYIK